MKPSKPPRDGAFELTARGPAVVAMVERGATVDSRTWQRWQVSQITPASREESNAGTTPMTEQKTYPKAVTDKVEEEAYWAQAAAEAMEESARFSWFNKAPASALVQMRETGKHWETGKKLTKWEYQALAEQWLQRFGQWPEGKSVSHEPDPREEAEDLEDDTMLRKRDVLRVTGLSESTLKRWIKAGTFPPPIRLGPDMHGWQARDVKAWIRERIEASRGKPRF